jgi:hypothetical protein
VFGGVLLFHPGWVVSSALAGLASGFGMGPGVSLPLWTAVTLFLLFIWGVFWWRGVVVVVWLRVFPWWVCVSFRPVSASSLNPLLGV